MKLGEADKIVTIFTEENGKVAAVAKGIRRTKSRFGARLEMFTNLELVIHKGRNLDTITQADIVETYPGITQNLWKINYGYAMLELIDKITPDRQAEPKIYQLLTTALVSLESASADSRLMLATFDLKLLAVTGFLPNLSACVICADKKRPIKRFSPEQGGVLCPNCRPNDPTAFLLEPNAISLARRLLYSPFKELEGVGAERETLDSLNRLIESHLSFHLSLRLKVRNFLDEG